MYVTVCYYHVTYEFQSESTLHSLPECHGTPCSKQAPYLKFKWQQRDSLTFRQTIACGFTQKLVRDMIITYSQMHRTDKYWQHSSIIWPVWLNGWLFVYQLSGCGFESRCCHLNVCNITSRKCFSPKIPSNVFCLL